MSNEGYELLGSVIGELINRSRAKNKDARRAVEQDIASNEFNWGTLPRRRWWQFWK